MADERRRDERAGAETVDPAMLLREAIEREYAGLCRGIEVLVWQVRPARDRDAVRARAEEVVHEAGRPPAGQRERSGRHSG